MFALKCARMLFLGATITVLGACNKGHEAEDAESKTKPAQDDAGTEVVLEEFESKISYLFGYSVAQQAANAGLKVDEKALLAAIDDVNKQRSARMSEEEFQAAGSRFQTMQGEFMTRKAQEQNVAQGNTYLEQNAKREGVIQTASGLQYEIIQAGTGKSPGPEDEVTVNYKGTLLDGTVFDSSYERDEPVTFPVNGVIAGWTEVLQLMQEGAKWKVVIPAELAYPNGTRTIEPGSTLVFEIELLKVNPKS